MSHKPVYSVGFRCDTYMYKLRIANWKQQIHLYGNICTKNPKGIEFFFTETMKDVYYELSNDVR